MDEMIRELIESRAKTWEQAKALLDRESAEDRSLDAEESEQFERMTKHIQELDARIDELHNLNVANKNADAKRAEYESVVRPDVVAAAEGDMDKQLRDLMLGKRRYVDISFRGLSAEPHPAHYGWQVRDLTKGSSSAGGDTVPTSFVNSLYEHMVENTAIRQTNVNVITTSSGENLEVPKTVSFGTAAIVAEGSAIGENDPTFGKVTLGAFKYGQLLQHSSELAQDTGVDLLGFLARDFGRALGNASGADYITGDGSGKPRGVIAATAADVGTAVQGTVASTISGDDLITLQYSVIEPYARNGFWLMRRATEGVVRKLKDDNGQYLWAPGLQAGSPNLLLGRPIVTDPNVAAIGSGNLSVAFGDFSAYTIRDVASVRIERSDDYAFANDMVSWRAILRTDGDLVDSTGAIKLLDTD